MGQGARRIKIEAIMPEKIKQEIKTKKPEIKKPKIKKKPTLKRKRGFYVETNADKLLESIQEKSMLISELALKLKVKEEKIEEWGLDLQEAGLVKVVYPTNILAGARISPVKKIKEEHFTFSKGKVIDSYEVVSDDVPTQIRILDVGKINPVYELITPIIRTGTNAIINLMTKKISEEVDVTPEELSDPRMTRIIKQKFHKKALEELAKKFPTLNKKMRKVIAGIIIHRMYGLKDIELLMSDEKLEEVGINGADNPVSVYHRKYGWCITNLKPTNEDEVLNFASSIGRKAGKSISFMNPLMDARLISGDRVQATLFPISSSGNTITIRKFSKNPWTITQYIDNKTVDAKIAALLWLAIHYELSIMIGGGTASGKTSCLNTLTAFIPPNQRVVSIEDIREIRLPESVHWNWIPLVVREGRQERAGNVSMLDLMIASLRMRPDRIIVGEVREKKQAEVLFEAIHTGHSVYTTIHADNAEQAFIRVVEEPLSIPKIEFEGLHLIAIMFRDRRRGFRKLIEVAEIVPVPGKIGERDIKINLLYRWSPREDKWEKIQDSERALNDIAVHTGMTEDDLKKDLKEKEDILNWMVNHKIFNVDEVGKVMEEYYRNPKRVIELARNNKSPGELL